MFKSVFYKNNSDSLLASYPFTIEQVVDKVMEIQGPEYIAAFGEEEYELKHKKILTERFTKLETIFRDERLPRDWDSYEPAGGIKMSMDPIDFPHFVQNKFKKLREVGILLSRSEFEKKEDPSKFRNPGKGGIYSQDLTRLWGAEYLRNILKNEDYKVPRFYLVVDEGVNEFTVNLRKDKMSVVINTCKKVAQVMVENIQPSGPSCSLEKDGWMLDAVGYIDFADSGNIRQSRMDGKFYVVDTEWKSLDGVVTHLNPGPLEIDNSITMPKLRRYASERFDALYNEEWKAKVSVSL